MGNKHNAALVWLARRRCNVILAMVRSGQAYKPCHTAAELADATPNRSLGPPPSASEASSQSSPPPTLTSTDFGLDKNMGAPPEHLATLEALLLR